MQNKGYSQYALSEISTASPEKLVVLAYDGMIRFLREAEEAIEARNFDVQNMKIKRVQDILALLSASLKPEHAPELCKALSSLYEWFQVRLAEANLNDDASIVREVRLQIADMKTAWDEAEKNTRPQNTMRPEATQSLQAAA